MATSQPCPSWTLHWTHTCETAIQASGKIDLCWFETQRRKWRTISTIWILHQVCMLQGTEEEWPQPHSSKCYWLTVKPENPFFKSIKNPISIHKTDAFSTHFSTNSLVKSVSNPNKSCLIHGMPHPLRQCKAFRTKNLEDRTTFLKESGICLSVVAQPLT